MSFRFVLGNVITQDMTCVAAVLDDVGKIDVTPAIIACLTRCAVQENTFMSVPASATAWVTVAGVGLAGRGWLWSLRAKDSAEPCCIVWPKDVVVIDRFAPVAPIGISSNMPARFVLIQSVHTEAINERSHCCVDVRCIRICLTAALL